MCGRFALYSDAKKVKETFDLDDAYEIELSYNIPPSSNIAVIVQTPENERKLCQMRWGFIPHWAKDKKRAPINARAETIASKPTFRAAFAHQRCLIIADGFFEWSRKQKEKKPYFITSQQHPFAMAGIWSHWIDPDDNKTSLSTCAIITTDANNDIKPLHDRMPIILENNYYDEWLDPAFDDKDRLSSLLAPFASELIIYPVTVKMNNPRFNEKKMHSTSLIFD